MNEPWKNPALHEVTYRARITLSERDWARLRQDANLRGISGAKLLSFIIADYARELGNFEDVPPGEPPPDDESHADDAPGPLARLRRPTITGPREMP